MLGEKKIVGNKYVKISAENKFRLPAFTGAEVGDEVIVSYMPTQKKVVIGTKALEDKMYELYYKIVSVKDLPEEEKRKMLRMVFGILTYETKLSSSKQILLPKKAIQHQIFQNKAYIVGKEEYVEVYPSEEDYTLSLKNN